MTARSLTGAPLAVLTLTLLSCLAARADQPPAPGAAPLSPSAPVASVAELETERNKLITQKKNLLAQIQHYEKDQVEATALNRARMGLAIVLAQEAILVLQLGADKAATFDEASELIRQAESYTVAVDSTTLSIDDHRVYSDLQAVCRRAISEEVAYLRGRLEKVAMASASPMQVVYQPTPVQTYVQPTPVTTYVVAPTVPMNRPRCSLFRRLSGR